MGLFFCSVMLFFSHVKLNVRPSVMNTSNKDKKRKFNAALDSGKKQGQNKKQRHKKPSNEKGGHAKQNKANKTANKQNNTTPTHPKKQTKAKPGSKPLCWWASSNSPVPTRKETRGRDLLANLLRLDADTFESEYFLQKPYVRHLTPEERKATFDNKSHPVYMLQMTDIDTLLYRKQPHPPRFLNDVDVTRYISATGKREALAEGNPPVNPKEVWKAFKEDGYSIRLVHPQQWNQPLFELCSYLQEYFGFPTGCSSYLTPAGSQGYPPHFDDVEIFVIQLDGCKRWRLYDRTDEETNIAARITKEFKQDELGEPSSEFVMQPGDVMYFPRGTVHQAVSCDDTHSLHLTFSTYQKHTWHDLLSHLKWDKSQKKLLEEEAKTNQWLHTCLPLNLMDLQFVGKPRTAVAWNELKNYFYDSEKEGRLPKKILRQIKTPGFLEHAIDSVSKEFYVNCLPPVNQSHEKPEDLAAVDFNKKKAYLTARHCARLINNNPWSTSSIEDWDKVDPEDAETCNDVQLVLYFNTTNGRSFSDPPSPQFEVLPCLASSVVQILKSKDEGITLSKLKAMKEEGERKESMLDLLDLMLQYNVIYIS